MDQIVNRELQNQELKEGGRKRRGKKDIAKMKRCLGGASGVVVVVGKKLKMSFRSEINQTASEL